MSKHFISMCPCCKVPIDSVEVYDTSWGDGEYTDTVYGTCPQCDKDYRWIETYKLASISDLKEVKDEDED